MLPSLLRDIVAGKSLQNYPVNCGETGKHKMRRDFRGCDVLSAVIDHNNTRRIIKSMLSPEKEMK